VSIQYEIENIYNNRSRAFCSGLRVMNLLAFSRRFSDTINIFIFKFYQPEPGPSRGLSMVGCYHLLSNSFLSD
jgi:hypothetical protein